ncbi:hypothetical protein ACFE04_013615 [Oxalis oulophora]
MERKSKNYAPTIWTPKLIRTFKSPYNYEIYGNRLEELKEGVRSMLTHSLEKSHGKVIKLIDTIQQLGVAYHFENEMNEVLDSIYPNINTESDLSTLALEFRILRSSGFSVSSGKVTFFMVFGMKGSKAESKPDNKLRTKATGTAKRVVKKGKAAKDPNKPKRPPSAFFVFMEGFRQRFKQDNPNNKSVAAVASAGGAEWKTLSDEEKAPYVAIAEKRKVEYTKVMQAYNDKLANGDDSDKSKSEVHDEDENVEEEDDSE